METEHKIDHREERWYQALFEADCMKVMKLLEEDPTLLKVGWTGEPNRAVIGSPDNCWAPKDPSLWKGRTALHVAARRGCVKLIEQVLVLCKLEGIEYESPFPENEQESITYRYVLSYEYSDPTIVISEGDHQRNFDTPQAAQTPSSAGRPVPSGEGEGAGADTEGKEMGESSQDPSSSTQPEAERGSMPETAQSADQSTELHSWRQLRKAGFDGDGRQKSTAWKKLREVRKVPSAISFWKRSARREKESNQQESTRLSDSPQFSPRHSGFGEGGSRDQYRISSDLISRKELRDLLLSKDGEFDLDALAMATLTGSGNLILPLVYGIGECENPPYEIRKTYISRETLPNAAKTKSNRDRLREATNAAINSFAGRSIFQTQFLDEYSRHPDFNFLRRGEYIFHFSFSSRFAGNNTDESRELQSAIIHFQQSTSRKVQCAHDEELWRFFWEYQDGQGRPPAHVAADERKGITLGPFEGFRGWTQRATPDAFTVPLTARDGAGRSLFLRWAAVGSYSYQKFQSRLFESLDWSPFYAWQGAATKPLLNEPWASTEMGGNEFFNVDALSLSNGFRFFASQYSFSTVVLTPFHAAFVHKSMRHNLELFINAALPIQIDEIGKWTSLFHYYLRLGDRSWFFDLTELACLSGDVNMLELLLAFEKRGVFKILPQLGSVIAHGLHWPAIHIAAHRGDYKMLEMLLEVPSCNPFIEDRFGNTALHNAMKVYNGEFKPHLLEYVSCENLLSNDLRKASQKANKNKDDGDLQRQGCINLLLQAGCDVFKTNKDGKIPYPRGTLSEDEKFMTWWYQRQSREFEVIQSNMNTASNAISVTAALVATASYVGPLQPPLGLGTTTNQIQSENGWVATFIFCDTLSFYLAIAAIILSLIPSLPMPEQSMMDEIRRTKRMVTMAVGALFPSVICVLIAFGSSSMAVVSAKILSSSGGKLTVTTMCIGGPVIVAAFFLFMVRLLGIVFPRNALIKSLYKLTSF